MPKLCYSSIVLCDNALRVYGKTRDMLSTAPRRTRGPKRSRNEITPNSDLFSLGLTESGRKVRKVSYAEPDSSDEDFGD